MSEERVKPIVITDKESGETYTLDFDKESVRFVEAQGFKILDPETYTFPNINIPKLFYYAFRMHHARMALNQTTALLEKMGGLTGEMVNRLQELYEQATQSNNVVQLTEDLEKNAKVAVEL